MRGATRTLAAWVPLVLVGALMGPAAAAGDVDPGALAVTEGASVRLYDGASWTSVALDGEPSLWAPMSWTADGEAIVYSGIGSGRRLVDLASGEERDLGGDALSPDGRAVSVTRDGALYVDPIGSAPERRVAGGGDDPYLEWGEIASWDPQSRWLAFTARRWEVDRTRGPWRLFVVADDGTGLRRLVPDDTVSVYGHTWSPDGTELGVAIGVARGDSDPAVVDVASGEVTRLATVAGTGRHLVGGPMWSTDGGLLAFLTVTSASAYTAEVRLHVVTRGGQPVATHDLVLTEQASDWRGPSWSPDGVVLAFQGGTNDSGDHQIHWDTYTVDVVTGALTQHDAAGDGTFDADELLVGYGPGVAIRRAGATRIETAATISRTSFASASHLVIGRSDLYADALAGAPLAALHDAPILLTASSGLHPAAADEVRRLAPTTAWLLGSTVALSPEVEQDLRDLGVDDVRRLPGQDRFDTARLIAEQVPATHVYLVEGRDPDPNRGWPDAVAVAGLAAWQGRPILLAETDRLPEATSQALDDLEVTHVTIVGGSPAISQAVEDGLRARGLQVDRLEGPDRYATSLAVARAAVAAGASPAQTWLATGRNWPDALGAGPAVAAAGGVLLLVDGSRADGGGNVGAWLDEHGAALRRVTLAGGPDVLGPGVDARVERG